MNRLVVGAKASWRAAAPDRSALVKEALSWIPKTKAKRKKKVESMRKLEALQARLGYAFRNVSLLELALTHSSWANEHAAGQRHNERLEFLGDAVLELAVSTRLFKSFPDAREGELTRMRSSLVNEARLAEVARSLELEGALRLARGEENQGGRQRDALLSDALEAVLGGVYLDGGFDSATAVVETLYARLWPKASGGVKRKDFKTRLQEVTQRTDRGLPVYTQEDASGPEHAKVFTVRVELPDGREFRAQGAGLKRAEQEAAKTALTALGELAPEDAGSTEAAPEDADKKELGVAEAAAEGGGSPASLHVKRRKA